MAMTIPLSPPLQDTWCIGSQYWSKNLHKEVTMLGTHILDMVGAPNAIFKRCRFQTLCSQCLKKVWGIANQLGLAAIFNITDSQIIDDHYYVNKLANIPTIDIIEHIMQLQSGLINIGTHMEMTRKHR